MMNTGGRLACRSRHNQTTRLRIAMGIQVVRQVGLKRASLYRKGLSVLQSFDCLQTA